MVLLNEPPMTIQPTNAEANLQENLPTQSDDEAFYQEQLSEDDIRQVMNPQRLAELLAQADAFSVVNSEKLDEF